VSKPSFWRSFSHLNSVRRATSAASAASTPESLKEQTAFKNQPPELTKALREANPALEVWALDEHRVGLKAILRYVWARRGKRPIAWAHPRYQWRCATGCWVYGFVCPETGETE
jgi:hypothetical protein